MIAWCMLLAATLATALLLSSPPVAATRV